jgi:hypothetical protein
MPFYPPYQAYEFGGRRQGSNGGVHEYKLINNDSYCSIL